MLDTMELEVLYADPDVFKGALGIYSKSRIHSWQKLVDDMYKEYDPYINFTRDEARVNTITRDLSDNRVDNLQTKRTAALTNGNTRTIERNAWNGSTNEDMVTAEQITDSGDLAGGTDTYNNTGSQSNVSRGTITTEDYYHSQGDSALFTPTDIARKEFELRAQLSAMEYILADIKTHFCLMVY
ncbi:MAG: hypothetical protein J6W33_01635 [Spirochaetia bacterium]|nr:hypothetical protein [Spirochaetia bacterium]